MHREVSRASKQTVVASPADSVLLDIVSHPRAVSRNCRTTCHGDTPHSQIVPLAVPIQGIEEMGVSEGDWVLIAGVGFIGFGSIINAKYRGARVIVLGRNKYRMEQARKMGADHIVNPDDENWLDQVHQLTGELKGADHVIEASGYPYYQKTGPGSGAPVRKRLALRIPGRAG